jgi:hypothetical protein
MLPPHLLTEFVYEERVCTVKLVEERGEFGDGVFIYASLG